MTTVATPKGSKAVEDVASIIKEFKTVYADAVAPCLTEVVWQEVSARRRLEWRSERRIPLQDAAVCYGQILHGYNEFQPHMIAALHTAFDDCGIEATPAREYSVAVYFHVPDKPGLRERVEEFVQANFDADEVSWEDSGTLRVWWD